MTTSQPRSRATAAAASSERLGVATMIVSTRARRGSPGFGVSSMLPAAPSSRCARTAAGGSMRYLASTASASAKVVRSATVGPEPITPGSSLGTSEISQDRTRAGCAAMASRPPLMAERCFRTVFISTMLAPDFSSARLTSCLSASVRPGAGRASSAEAPPEIRQSTRSSAREALDLLEDAAGGGAALLVGHGMGGLDDLDALAGLAVAVARDDQAFERMRPLVLDARAPSPHSPCRRRSRWSGPWAAAAWRCRARGRWRGGRRPGRHRTGRAAGRGRRHLSFAQSSHYRGAMQQLLGPGDPPPFSVFNETGQGAAAAALRSRQQGRAAGAGRSRHLRAASCRATSAGTSAASTPRSNSPRRSTRRWSRPAIRGW